MPCQSGYGSYEEEQRVLDRGHFPSTDSPAQARSRGRARANESTNREFRNREIKYLKEQIAQVKRATKTEEKRLEKVAARLMEVTGGRALQEENIAVHLQPHLIEQ